MKAAAASFMRFATPIGVVALAWRGGRIAGVRMRAEGARPFADAVEADAPPAFVLEAVAAIQAALSGDPVTLEAIPVDIDALPDFERAVLAACRAIPLGETRTYGELAAAVGNPGAARAVGAALGRNPVPIIIPCHRVLAADGRTGGFSAPGGVDTKMKLLDIERARRGSEPGLFDALPWDAGVSRREPRSGPPR